MVRNLSRMHSRVIAAGLRNKQRGFFVPFGGGESAYAVRKAIRIRPNAYLSRTNTVVGSRQAWTFSTWVKRGRLATGESGVLWANSSKSNVYSVNNWTGIRFLPDDTLDVLNAVGGAVVSRLTTVTKFRDTSGYYHVQVVLDANNATQSDRLRLYINGNRITAFTVATYPASTGTTSWALADTNHYLGMMPWSGSTAYPTDLYQAEVHLVGQALGPEYFGHYDPRKGAWVPKRYIGPWGTNGCYLPFTDGTSLTTLAQDLSGNDSHWTCNGISLTSGTAYDWMDDTPTNNYCRFSLLDKAPTSYHDWGSAIITSNAASVPSLTRGSMGVSTGKWYWEGTVNNATTDFYHGVQTNSASLTSQTAGSVHINQTGQCYVDGVLVATFAGSAAKDDTVSIALDLDAGVITWRRNNVVWGSRAIGANTWFPVTGNFSTGSAQVINFGQRPFVYPPPTGFKAICTQNLPEVTITTSGSFTGNLNADGPSINLNGVPLVMTINGNLVTWGTHADKTAYGFKLRISSTSYNASGSNTFSVTSTGAKLKYANAQINP